MQNMSSLISNFSNKVDLDNSLIKDFLDAKKDASFDELTNKLSLSIEELSKYTSLLRDSSLEYHNCKHCKNILECQNKITGYAYLPKEVQGKLIFSYQPCKKKIKENSDNAYIKNMSLFGLPKELGFASMNNIYMEDKNRYKTIKWLKEFIESYSSNPHQKGLYLHGNFGCGKTYLVAASFSTLAKRGIKSAIVFWPDFLRELKSSFQNDYQAKVDKIKKIPILCIDDIGAEAVTSWGRDEVLCSILQYRMQSSLPTFFTSNLDIKALEQHFSITHDGVEELKSRRVIERILQLTDDIEMVSANLRK